MPFTQEGSEAFLRAYLETNAVFVSRHTGTPPTSVNEITGGGYAREEIAAGAWTYDKPTGFGRARNSSAELKVASGAQPDSTTFGIWTTATGTALAGLLAYADFSNNPAAPQTGSSVGWQVNALALRIPGS